MAMAYVVMSLAAFRASAQAPKAAESVDELRALIERHITEARFHAAIWGIRIKSLDTGCTVFEHHSDRLVSPASNSKLYVAALALAELGGDYRILTPVVSTAKPDRSGKVKGDLIVCGRGDPSWKLVAGETNFWRLLQPFVTVASNAGVRRITGDIVADGTFFVGTPDGSGWCAGDLEDSDGAEISAVTLADNANLLQVSPGARVGLPCAVTLAHPHSGLSVVNHTVTSSSNGLRHVEARRVFGETALHVFGEIPVGDTNEVLKIAVPRPAQWFAAALKESLVRSGIRVDGTARSLRWPQAAAVSSNSVLLGDVASPPMRDMLRAFMKPSQNLEADLIFNHAGELTRTTATPAWRTSEQLAVAALESFMLTNNLPAADLHFDEGSGLSRNNLTTANATLALLKFMSRHSSSNDFINSLPVAGVDGTLRRRMKGTPAANNLRAKTGTLRWSNTLSGYVTSAAGERFVFSLNLNRNATEPGRNNREELDAIAVMLVRFAGRTSATASPSQPAN